jgi:hypothetical protein
MGKANRLRTERAAAEIEREREAAEETRIASADFSRKLDRAKTHIEAVEDAIQGWLQSDAYTITEDVEAETGDHVLVAKVVEPFGQDWPLVIGDAVHNLRSALDHIAYQLALGGYQTQHHGGPIPLGHQRRIMFPVVATSNNPSLSVGDFYAQVAKGQLRYVPHDAAAAIKALQPYQRSPGSPANDLLWVVNELDIIDKHRKLHAMAVANPLQAMQISGNIYIEHMTLNGGPVEGERELMRWNIASLGPHPAQMQRQFSRHVALTEGPELAQTSDLITLLRACYADIVENVVPALARFL